MDQLSSRFSRILFAAPFGIFGLMHLTHANEMSQKVPFWLPGGVTWIYLSGIALILVCVSFVTQIGVKNASMGLAAILVIFTLTVHVPGLKSDNPQMDLMSILKNISLIGASLTYTRIFSIESSRKRFETMNHKA